MKKQLRFITVLVMVCACHILSAQVVVSPAAGGANICTNNAQNRLTSLGIPVALDTIMLRESAPGDFAAGLDSIQLRIPGGWFLWVGMPYVAFINTGVASELDSVAMIYAYDHITLYMHAPHTSALDTIILGGFGIVATSDTAHTSQIYAASVYGVSGITTGVTGTDFCPLSLSPQPVHSPYLIWCTAIDTATDATPGGTWSSTDTTVAVVNPVTGVITPRSFGNDTIIYKIDTCWMKHPVVVYCEGAVPVVTGKPQDVHLYPNPGHVMLSVSCSALLKNITMTDLLGQTVYTAGELTSYNKDIDVSTLPQGMYLVRVNGEVHKWIKD